MSKKAEKITLSIYHEHASWLANTQNKSRYAQQCFDWRITRFTGACVYLRRIDKRLVETAVEALRGMDWHWYPDPEHIAERLAATEGDEYWEEFIEAVKGSPKLAYALETVTREVYSANTKASELI